MADKFNILLLGGTLEGVELNRRFAHMEGVRLITALAGVTKNPVSLEGELFSGGFGGVAGLSEFIRANDIALIMDATHPFAATISLNACKAADLSQTPLMRFVRPAWTAVSGDQWIYVADPAAAAKSLDGWSRPFLSIGRKDLGSFAELEQKEFLVRSIEATDFDPAHSRAVFVEERGPFDEASEMALLKAHAVDVLVTKNSGGQATYGKILAARALQIPVVMIERPQEPAKDQHASVTTLAEAASQMVQAFRLGRST